MYCGFLVENAAHYSTGLEGAVTPSVEETARTIFMKQGWIDSMPFLLILFRSSAKVLIFSRTVVCSRTFDASWLRASFPPIALSGLTMVSAK